jgi:hypothetical protein
MATETLILLAAITTGVVTAALQNLKWLRVAQRVHYLPREVARVERLWFDRRPLGALWWGLAAIFALLSVQGTAWLDMPELAWAAVVAPLFILPAPWETPLSWRHQPSSVDAAGGAGICGNSSGAGAGRSSHGLPLGPCRGAYSPSFHVQPG